jgi:hypothetical protein
MQDGGKFKRHKDIHHHGPMQIRIICHLCLLLHFSLVATFNVAALYSAKICFQDGDNIYLKNLPAAQSESTNEFISDTPEFYYLYI